jgi:beta-glucanase (GH16 family)
MTERWRPQIAPQEHAEIPIVEMGPDTMQLRHRSRFLKELRAFLVLLFVSIASAAPHSKWTLIWSDEFKGPKGSPPEPTKWTYDLGGGGWGNHELEEYTDNKNNVSLDGRGHLAIQAERLESGKLTSARLKTQGRFGVQYGKIEARIKIPRGQGVWPAFWMLGENISTVGWPNCGEIDIMENIGSEPSIVHGTVHGPGYSGAKGVTAHAAAAGHGRLAAGFHVFGVEWEPEFLEFSLDQKPYAKVTRASIPVSAQWPFDGPFFMLINVAVGGDWPGQPDATTRFPQIMLIDWVRVWKPERNSKQPTGQPLASRPVD